MNLDANPGDVRMAAFGNSNPMDELLRLMPAASTVQTEQISDF